MPIGKIDIMRKFSFFEVPSDFKNDILNGLRDVKWHGVKVNVEISQIPGNKSNSGKRRMGGKEKRKVRTNITRNKKSDRKNSSFKAKFNAASKRKN